MRTQKTLNENAKQIKAERLFTTKFLLHIWHKDNHTKCLNDPVMREAVDPKHPANAALVQKYNTEVREQALVWLDRYVYGFLDMGPGVFMAQVYFLMDRRNSVVV